MIAELHLGKNTDKFLRERFPNQGRQPEDIEIWTHSNETLATVRRRIMARVKSTNQTAALSATAGVNASLIQSQVVGHQQPTVQQQQQSGVKLDLYLNNELIEPSEGYRLVADLPLRDKTVCAFSIFVFVFS